jgi:hypothetical protein
MWISKYQLVQEEDEDEQAKYGSIKDVVARQSPIVPDARSEWAATWRKIDVAEVSTSKHQRSSDIVLRTIRVRPSPTPRQDLSGWKAS